MVATVNLDYACLHSTCGAGTMRHAGFFSFGPLRFEKLGEKNLKNVSEPFVCYAVQQ